MTPTTIEGSFSGEARSDGSAGSKRRMGLRQCSQLASSGVIAHGASIDETWSRNATAYWMSFEFVSSVGSAAENVIVRTHPTSVTLAGTTAPPPAPVFVTVSDCTPTGCDP